MTKKPGLPQPRSHTNDQCLTRKLVERSQAVLNCREATKRLPRDQSVINQPPLPVPIPPDQVRESDTPVHVPPFMSPNPAFHKPKVMNEVDVEYDPLMDTDSPYDDALVEIVYCRPVDDDFTLPPSLEKQIDQGRLAKRDLPRQAEIDRDMRCINCKVLRNIHLPLTLHDLQAAYLQSPQF